MNDSSLFRTGIGIGTGVILRLFKRTNYRIPMFTSYEQTGLNFRI
jgi:hypothetical protein